MVFLRLLIFLVILPAFAASPSPSPLPPPYPLPSPAFPSPPSVSHSIFLVLSHLDLSLGVPIQAGCSSISCLSQSLLPPASSSSWLFVFFPGPPSFPLLSFFLCCSLSSSLSFPLSPFVLHPCVSPLLSISPSSVAFPVSFSVSLASALMVPLPVSIFILLTHLPCPLLCLSVSPPPASPRVPAPGPN